MKTLLITGFEPFGGETINPSWEAVQRLPEVVGDYRLEKLRIPVVFGLAAQKVLDYARQDKPDKILCVGQAGGRAGVTPEYIAINLRHASIDDNAGNRPQDVRICPHGPAGIFSTLPVRKMAQAAEVAGVKSAVSYSAGTFVCNDLLYSLLWELPEIPAGFVHVPFLPEQAKEGVPSMPLEDIITALTAMIRAL